RNERHRLTAGVGNGRAVLEQLCGHNHRSHWECIRRSTGESRLLLVDREVDSRGAWQVDAAAGETRADRANAARLLVDRKRAARRPPGAVSCGSAALATESEADRHTAYSHRRVDRSIGQGRGQRDGVVIIAAG